MSEFECPVQPFDRYSPRSVRDMLTPVARERFAAPVAIRLPDGFDPDAWKRDRDEWLAGIRRRLGLVTIEHGPPPQPEEKVDWPVVPSGAASDPIGWYHVTTGTTAAIIAPSPWTDEHLIERFTEAAESVKREMAAGTRCPRLQHCGRCKAAGCVVVSCKRDRSACPCAPFHRTPQ
jgi:hypothetical protein